MAKKNELLNQDIDNRINDVRYESDDNKEKDKKPLFYLIVVVLVTVSALFSLFRFLL